MTAFADLPQATRTELEAAAFRRLTAHLANRTDVQNIDLMILGGFCRNCLSNWLADAAKEHAIDLPKDAAREAVYGMPYSAWKDTHQLPATPEQEVALAVASAKAHG